MMLGVAIVLVLVLVGVPLFAAIAAGSLLGYWRLELDPGLFVMEFVRLADHAALPAVVLFGFSGMLIARSRLPGRLVERVRGGRSSGLSAPLLVVALCMVIGALSGLTAIAVLAMGGLLAPVLVQAGHSRGEAAGLLPVATSAGVLLAPSVSLILYLVIVQHVAPRSGVDMTRLLLAAAVPGLLLAALTALLACSGRARTAQPETAGSGLSLWTAVGWELPLPFIVLGGLYSGWLNVVDAALLTTLWLLVTLVVVRRDLDLWALACVAWEAMVVMSALLLLLGVSLAAVNLLLDGGFMQRAAQGLGSLAGGSSPLALWSLALVLVAAGLVFELPVALVMLAPLTAALGIALGIHPLHLCIVSVLAIQTGQVAAAQARRVRRRDGGAARPATAMTLVAVLAGVLALVVAWPVLSLWLPGQLPG